MYKIIGWTMIAIFLGVVLIAMHMAGALITFLISMGVAIIGTGWVILAGWFLKQ
jgi:hypothetical protein